MDIYEYLAQVKLFLTNQERRALEPLHAVPAERVMQFRRATLLSVLDSKCFLSQFSPIQQLQCLEMAEQVAAARIEGSFLRDPIEDDSTIRPLFLAVCEEVTQEIEIWHQQRIAELEQSTPAVAELFRSKLGLCHREWARVKQLLWERYHINWRSPEEMNPWTTFD
jgi:hypothetical protein